jgi:hypothetical protein
VSLAVLAKASPKPKLGGRANLEVFDTSCSASPHEAAAEFGYGFFDEAVDGGACED